MKRTINLKGTAKELAQQLSEESCKKTIVIFGFCKAIFDGRIKSFLPGGDRLLIVKKDESLILHGSKGVKPLNWQKSGAGKINYSAKGSTLVVSTFRPKTKETLEILFTQVYQTTTFDDHDSATLNIFGSESDLSDYLFDHPEIIGPDFQPTTREYETPFGFIDLRGVDKHGNIIIVEVKKQSATPADAHQLKRYVDYFQDVEKVSVRGVLVAAGFSEKVLSLLRIYDFKPVVVFWQEIFPSKATLNMSHTLDDFYNNNPK